jgi:flagellar hook protein FlgE
MSIYGALAAGVSALQANSSVLGMISDNIANANTVGYKREDGQFSTLVTGQTTADYSPGGVRAAGRTLMDQQGLMQTTQSPTDIAISGNGFFVVSPAPTTGTSTDRFLFTRAGSFVKDSSGFLKNAAGYYLEGWPVQANGTVNADPSDLTQLQTINLENLGGTAEATTQLTVNANLDATTPVSVAEGGGPGTPPYNAATYVVGDMAAGTAGVTPDFSRSIQVFDSQGGLRTVTVSLMKTSVANVWDAEIYSPDVDDGSGNANGLIASGQVAFTANGLLDTANTTLPTSLSIGASGAAVPSWSSTLGVAASSITLNLGSPGAAGGFTQFASASALISSQVDGAVFGNLSGVQVDNNGFVTALFDNGIEKKIYQIPIATFINPAGLSAQNGNAYSVTNDSGPFNLKIANTGGAGKVEGSSLEQSTVDIAQEFTSLITTQRAYSASTKIITTADDMLQELIQIKR